MKNGSKSNTNQSSDFGSKPRSQAPKGTPNSSPLTNSQVRLLVATAISILLLILAGALLWLWSDSLPSLIAVHWDGSGTADGFASIGGFAAVIAAIMIPSMLLLAALGFAAKKSTLASRTLSGTIVFLGSLTLAITVFSVEPQRHLESAKDAQLSPWAVVGSIAISAFIGILTSFIGKDPKAPTPKQSPKSATSPKETITWVGKTSMRPGPLWGSVGTLTLLLAWVAVASDWWIPFVTVIPVIAALSSLSVFNVKITSDGLTVRAWPGWPTKQIAASQIRDATVVEVHPLQEFGGWGYRSTIDGTEGIVMRKGPGIKVLYDSDKELTVTLNNGSQQAAELLNTAADWVRNN